MCFGRVSVSAAAAKCRLRGSYLLQPPPLHRTEPQERPGVQRSDKASQGSWACGTREEGNFGFWFAGQTVSCESN